jgi:hypothetical protein
LGTFWFSKLRFALDLPKRSFGDTRSQTGVWERENLIATIYNVLDDVGELRLVPGMLPDVAQAMTSWEPIPGLL